MAVVVPTLDINYKDKKYLDIMLSIKEKSVDIVSQSSEEFLKNFPINSLYNKFNIEAIENLIEYKGKQLGPGGSSGTAYGIEGTDFVIKRSTPCPEPVYEPDELCIMARNGDLIYRIPSTVSNKTIIAAPNYFLEGLIGSILSENLNDYTPSFMKIYGFQYDPTSIRKNWYIMTEKLQKIDDYIKDDKDYIYHIFQLVFAINAAQKYGRYVHYDLHQDNFMAREKDSHVAQIYEIGNGKYLYSLFPFDTTIIDYGHNRIETLNNILQPKLTFIFEGREVVDNYFFNPFYDLFTILYTTHYKVLKGGYKNWKKERTEGIPLTLIKMMLGMKPNENHDKKISDWVKFVLIQHDVWRPSPEKLADSRFYVRTPNDFITIIVSEIEKMIPTPENTPDGHAQHLITHKFFVSSQLYDLTGIHEIKGTKIYNQVAYSYQEQTSFNRYRVLDRPISLISGPIKIDSFDKDYRRVHIIEIDERKGLDTGYRYRFECCKIDIKNYFQNESLDSGMALTLSSYNNRDDFTPVGFFKSKDYRFTTDVPEQLREYYGIVTVNEKGKIILDGYDYNGVYEQFLTAGPMLIVDSKIIMTNDLVNNETIKIGSDIVKAFQCRKPNSGEGKDLFFKDQISNCNNMEPGYLFRAGSKASRTALIIRRDKNPLFVHVTNITLPQLALLCSEYGARYAISLDDGINSRFVWKNPGEDIINVSNSEKPNTSPSSTILSFVRNKINKNEN